MRIEARTTRGVGKTAASLRHALKLASREGRRVLFASPSYAQSSALLHRVRNSDEFGDLLDNLATTQRRSDSLQFQSGGVLQFVSASKVEDSLRGYPESVLIPDHFLLEGCLQTISDQEAENLRLRSSLKLKERILDEAEENLALRDKEIRGNERRIQDLEAQLASTSEKLRKVEAAMMRGRLLQRRAKWKGRT